MEGRLDFRFGFRKELRVLQKLLIKVDVICLARVMKFTFGMSHVCQGHPASN